MYPYIAAMQPHIDVECCRGRNTCQWLF